MDISMGLFDRMVIQRNSKGVSGQPFAGACAAGKGIVTVAVSKGGKPLKGFAKVEAGTASGGKFKGVLKGLPVGGPYDLKLEAVDRSGRKFGSCSVKDVLVGDVWMLGGQSNMEGIGDMKHALRPDPMVRAYYMDARWGVAKDPLHNLDEAADPVHPRLMGGGKRDPRKGVGPGLAFAQEMRRRTGVPQGLVSSGHGGTSMAQWDPKLKRDGGDSLYGAMCGRFERNGGSVAGMVWYQGCSDANPSAAKVYTRKMLEFVKAVRRDFRAPSLPFATVQIGRFVSPDVDIYNWNFIREQQRLLPQKISRLQTVPAIDLGLDDIIHIGGRDQARLGRRLAEAMLRLTGVSKGLPPPPIELESVKVEDDRFPGNSRIVVKFKNVSGSLSSPGRPGGFSLLCGERDMLGIFSVELEGSKVALRVALPKNSVKGYELYYGYGVDPYCNVVDGADRSLPAFGPLPLGSSLPMTPFATKFQASDPVFGDESPEALVHPSKRDGLVFRPALSGGFFSLPADREKFATPEPKIRYFRTFFDCPEEMDVKLLFGYDGPVKLYSDGAEVFSDPKGTNPIAVDEASVKLRWTKGLHEVVFALSINQGKAWGVCLRIARPGFKRRGDASPAPLPTEALVGKIPSDK